MKLFSIRHLAMVAAALTFSAAAAQVKPAAPAGGKQGKVRKSAGGAKPIPIKQKGGKKAAKAKQTEPAEVDEKAEAVLREWSEKLAARKDFQVRVNSEFNMSIGGIQRKQPRTFDISVLRPAHMRIQWVEQDFANDWILRDQQLLNYRGAIKKYKVDKVSGAKDELPKALSQVFGNLKADKFMTALLADDPMQAARWTATKIEYVGKDEIEGKTTHRLLFISDEVDWTVWFDSADGALPIRVVPDATKELKAQGLSGVNYDVRLDLVDWKVDEGLALSAFEFQPPAGSEKVDSFNPNAKGAAKKPGPSGSAEELVGKPAPGFSLDLLGGGKADLAAHRGKDVVVLDFWATWCGPCRRALPLVSEACDKYPNVVLYTVNLREDAEKIGRFMEAQGLQMKVAMDKGEVGQAYGANRIPLSVVIDKDGVVQAIHRGFSPDLGTQLDAELKQLLEGKKLVEPQ